MNDGVGVKVMILDREYQVACPDEEKEGLLSAASYLDAKMRDMRNRSHNIGAVKTIHESCDTRILIDEPGMMHAEDLRRAVQTVDQRAGA